MFLKVGKESEKGGEEISEKIECKVISLPQFVFLSVMFFFFLLG